MWEFLNRLLGRDIERSKDLAKKRLRLVLIHDKVDMTQQVFESLRKDLIGVISKYMDIDEDKTEVHLDSQDGLMALVASIPVVRIKRKADKEKS